ncbi:MAG: ATP-binding protein [Candidatus Tectomicrobia bacterium]
MPIGYTRTALEVGEETGVISTRVPDDAARHRSLEERLRQAQKMENMGRLISGVAHDFNNILTVMTGYSAMLMCRLSPDDPAYEAAAEIKKVSDRAASLTRQLLGFSRTQVVEMQPLHLHALLTNMDGMLRQLMREDIELIIELDPALRSVQADPGQIEQVIMNLAVNARDAMPTGGVLRIETTSIARGQHDIQRQCMLRSMPYVRLAVSDTGRGIETETRLHLFEPFFTTKKLGQGTGLGLSTVHDIVKRSGGTIWVNSQSGHGTTFEIYLPQGETQVEACSSRDSLHASLQDSETILLLKRISEAIPGYLDDISVIAGTSSGAVNGLILAQCEHPTEGLDNCIRFWHEPSLMSNTPWGTLLALYGLAPFISLSNYKSILRRYIPEHVRSGELKKNVLVTAFELQASSSSKPGNWHPRLFKSWEPACQSFSALGAALFSSSAPVLQAIQDGYIDGGAYNSSPCVSALASGKSLLQACRDEQSPGQMRAMLEHFYQRLTRPTASFQNFFENKTIQGSEEDILLLSVSTGFSSHTVNVSTNGVTPWGVLQWLIPTPLNNFTNPIQMLRVGQEEITHDDLKNLIWVVPNLDYPYLQIKLNYSQEIYNYVALVPMLKSMVVNQLGAAVRTQEAEKQIKQTIDWLHQSGWVENSAQMVPDSEEQITK